MATSRPSDLWPDLPLALPPGQRDVPPNAVRYASGLAVLSLTPGREGRGHPEEDSEVTIRFVAWDAEGASFDSSGTNPVRTRVDALSLGLAEAVQLMTPGDRWRVWVPESLSSPRRAGAPTGRLIFDLVLVDYDGGTPRSVPGHLRSPSLSDSETD